MGHISTDVELTVTVDECRIRLQTGEPTVFLDARKVEDWDAATAQITGAIRVDDRTLKLPCLKSNYIVVNCA